MQRSTYVVTGTRMGCPRISLSSRFTCTFGFHVRDVLDGKLEATKKKKDTHGMDGRTHREGDFLSVPMLQPYMICFPP